MSNGADLEPSIRSIEGLRDRPWRGEPGAEAVVAVVPEQELEIPSKLARNDSHLMVYSNSAVSCDVHGQDGHSHRASGLSSTREPKGAQQVQPHGEV